ncbi:MAG TPA: Rieske (2Fe-2S) protein [Firmicutes bacterium]|nr:Rieske (2Fe-2S) protein [Bacillota bacterium]
MSRWEKAMPVDELPENTLANRKMGGRNILLARVDGQYYALLNDCPHLGCFLHKGLLRGHTVTCPCHDWVFDLRTGEFTAAPEIAIPVFPVKVTGGEIYVDLGGDVT